MRFCFSILPAVSRRDYHLPESTLRGSRSFCTATTTRIEACLAPRKHRLSRISGKTLLCELVSLAYQICWSPCYLLPFFPTNRLSSLFLGSFGFFTRGASTTISLHPLVLWGFQLLKIIDCCRAKKKRESLVLVFCFDRGAAVPFHQGAGVDSHGLQFGRDGSD